MGISIGGHDITGGLISSGDPLNLFGAQGQYQADKYSDKLNIEKARVADAYKKARERLAAGSQQAQGTARQGFQTARGTTTGGYSQARSELASGMGSAINTAKEGYAKAQSFYDTPEMVASRAELYQRILGKGGYSPDETEAMKASAREEYGTGMRGAMEAMGQFSGDSQARGIASENMARAASEMGAKRAGAVRDVDLASANLRESQQTDAISQMREEAYQRAGLSSQEAQYISGLQARLAEGTSNLTAQETNALSQIAQNEGMTLADLQYQLATGEASLTTEEATAIANMTMAGEANMNQMNSGGVLSNLLG